MADGVKRWERIGSRLKERLHAHPVHPPGTTSAPARPKNHWWDPSACHGWNWQSKTFERSQDLFVIFLGGLKDLWRGRYVCFDLPDHLKGIGDVELLDIWNRHTHGIVTLCHHRTAAKEWCVGLSAIFQKSMCSKPVGEVDRVEVLGCMLYLYSSSNIVSMKVFCLKLVKY